MTCGLGSTVWEKMENYLQMSSAKWSAAARKSWGTNVHRMPLIFVKTVYRCILPVALHCLKGNWYFFRGDNSIKFVFDPFWKGVYYIRKEFAPRGSKFFPYIGGPFQKGINMQESKQGVTKIVPFGGNGEKSNLPSVQSCRPRRKWRNFYHVYPVP